MTGVVAEDAVDELPARIMVTVGDTPTRRTRSRPGPLDLVEAIQRTEALAELVPDYLDGIVAAIRRGKVEIGNPYLDLVRGLPESDGDLPSFAAGPAAMTSSVRAAAVAAFAWGIPGDDALDAIAAVSPRGVVEVGAGTGYWARMLLDRGVDVVAYDIDPPGAGWSPPDPGKMRAWTKAARWADVRQATAGEAAARHPDRTLLIVWPPHGEPMATAAALAYHAAGGETVAYVGEVGGCTAESTFHALLGHGWACELCTLNRPGRGCGGWCRRSSLFEPVEDVDVPRWEGIRDSLGIYRRTPFDFGRPRPALLAGPPMPPFPWRAPRLLSPGGTPLGAGA